MNPLSNPLATRPIQTGWAFTMKLYPSGKFGFIDDPEHQVGNGLVSTWTRTRSDGPEPLRTLAQGGSPISTGREDFAGGSAVLPTLSEGLEIELSNFEAENATPKGDHLQRLVEIVIRGVQSVLEIKFMSLFMSIVRIQWQGSVLMNLFDPGSHQVDDWIVEVVI